MHRYFVQLRVDNWSSGTIARRGTCLGRFLKWCAERDVQSLADITPEVIEAYRHALFHHHSEWIEKYRIEVRESLLRDPTDVLFLTTLGNSFHPCVLSLRIRTYLDAVGITKAGSCHMLRHTAATLMLEGGADLRSLQQFLRHENLNTTQIYTHVTIQRLREVHERTHPGASDRKPQPPAEPGTPTEPDKPAAPASPPDLPPIPVDQPLKPVDAPANRPPEGQENARPAAADRLDSHSMPSLLPSRRRATPARRRAGSRRQSTGAPSSCKKNRQACCHRKRAYHEMHTNTGKAITCEPMRSGAAYTTDTTFGDGC
jgi:hypothetical protein